jgi:signal transduction histidine kinase
MKLTKKQQSEILKVYNGYWDGYLKGDIARMAALLDPKFTQVGSAETEVFFNKKDAVKFLHDTIDQVAGQLEMRKRVIRKELLEASVLINEQCDLYAKSGRKWIFFSKFRASTTLHEKSGKWKIIHQHSSFPDLRAQDGENIAIEKIEEENLKLKDAIKRRTIELEEKNRELKIEAALERVRTVAMAMSKPDDLLKICKQLFSELKKLGFGEIRNAMINVYDDANASFINYDFSDENGTSVTHIKNDSHAVVKNYLKQARKTRDAFAPFSLSGSKLKDWIEFRKRNGEKTDPKLRKAAAIHYYFYSIGDGAMGISTLKTIPDEQINILKRFRNVFDLAYKRYTDIAHAEAQAREARIETALERVRAGAMALKRSEDLSVVCKVIYNELVVLGFTNIRNAQIAINLDLHQSYLIFEYSDFGTINMKKVEVSDGNVSPLLQEIAAEMAGSKNAFFQKQIGGKEFEQWRKWRVDTDGLKDPRVTMAHSMWFYLYGVESGLLGISTFDEISEDQVQVLKRFKNVFELSYRRYADVAQAEAQAREAQIEASLERVRARTMAMHNSQDVSATAIALFNEVSKLGLDNSIRCGIGILEGADLMETWSVNSLPNGEVDLRMGMLDMSIHPLLVKIKNSWKKGNPTYTDQLSGKEVLGYYKALNNAPDYPFNANLNSLPEKEFHNSFSFREGIIFAFAPNPMSEEAAKVFERFAHVFGQTYRRYLDLKKAEASTREAKIEAALERVRSRSMAMHKSDELSEIISTVYNQLVELNIEMDSINFDIFKEGRSFDIWAAAPNLKYSEAINISDIEFGTSKLLLDARESGIDFISAKWTAEEKNKWFKVAFERTGFKHLPQERKDKILLGKVWTTSTALSKYSAIQLNSYSRESFSVDENEIVKRFSKVFDQSYTRFLDLQKAEAQAREAQIEASLERVRGKAMAMHSSEDLAATIGVFYRELELLSITPRRCGVGLLDKENHTVELSTMSTKVEGGSIELIGTVKLIGHPVLEEIYDNWILQKEYHPVLRGNEIKAYYQVIQPQVAYPEYPNDAVHYGYFFYFPEGGVYAWTEKELSEDELKTYRRFTSVLGLAYKRYKDLNDVEAREKDAIRQASLDRVRAEIASMRTVKDLERITPLIWRELTTLGIPFVRCGVFIIDNEQQQVHTFLSTPDGKAIAAAHQSFETATSLSEAITAWQEHKTYVTRWVDKDFQAQADVLIKQGAITSRDQYLSTIPKEGIYLHFLPFLQGMLYVGNTAALHADDLNLVHAVADAFSTAYARYEDFNKLEAAKQQVDKTLVDLKQAQQQLIQSEKMASLGELTAGIAHEIQNPLNFVNNFSEVSNELIDEMKAEQDAGNWSLATEISDDLKSNLEKILHHGKRAEGIVKGMLQHSRTSSGVKEPTDINALCDEYLRLSYHGLRAKDKSFNAKFETDFDSSLPKINVVPQDIGRVVLNLINNAFYAVNQQRITNNEQLEPLVKVSTKNLGNKFEIRVQDNGNGIPQNIVDKIFQPFFTTKPTGQGTGLGLSLSYDIVKAHGGELKVESKEGDGSEFIIQIPLV